MNEIIKKENATNDALYRFIIFSFPLAKQIEDILKQPPKIELEDSQILKTWKNVGPISIKDFMRESSIPLNFDGNKFYIKSRSYISSGIVEKRKQWKCGINRYNCF